MKENKLNTILRKYSKNKIKLLIRYLDKKNILIEGDKVALEFLGNLFLAQADEIDCGFQLNPIGPGSNYFNSGSKMGFYIHRIPCDHKKISS